MSFTLAHFSDTHLGPLPDYAAFRHFRLKRLLGTLSWGLRRRHMHLTSIADAVAASIKAQRPDHIAFTGDALNIAAWEEFPRAAQWISQFGSSDGLSFVPGNHDTYVPVPWDEGLAHFMPWMRPDRRDAGSATAVFPFIRYRRNVALIGANSGTPQNLLRAGGTLGARQLQDIGHALQQAGQQGFYRILMIHHPPLPGLTDARRALTDAMELEAAIAAAGCELVLHGHNHKSMLNWLDTAAGPCAVVGAPSASMAGDDRHEPGGWNHFRIRRHDGRWLTEMTPCRWHPQKKIIEHGTTAIVSPK